MENKNSKQNNENQPQQNKNLKQNDSEQTNSPKSSNLKENERGQSTAGMRGETLSNAGSEIAGNRGQSGSLNSTDPQSPAFNAGNNELLGRDETRGLQPNTTNDNVGQGSTNRANTGVSAGNQQWDRIENRDQHKSREARNQSGNSGNDDEKNTASPAAQNGGNTGGQGTTHAREENE